METREPADPAEDLKSRARVLAEHACFLVRRPRPAELDPLTNSHEPIFQFDLLLSHKQADKPRVRRLAVRLRAAGLRQLTFDIRHSSFGFPPKAAWVGPERSTVGRGNLPFRDPINSVGFSILARQSAAR